MLVGSCALRLCDRRRRANHAEEGTELSDKLTAISTPGRQIRPEGYLRGLMLALALGGVGYWIGNWATLIGGPVAALVLGVALRAVWAPGETFRPGLRFSQKILLQAAIVLAGAGLTIGQALSSGLAALPLILMTILAGLFLIPTAGRRLGLERRVTHLVAVGTAICGATAIGAVGPQIGATAADMAYAVSTIFLFNLLAAIVYPLLGHLAGFTDWMFGLWSGTAIHDTSSVLAAAYAFSDRAGQLATIVKLTRTTMLLPVMVGYGLLFQTQDRKPSLSAALKSFPRFVLLFVVAAVVNSAGIIPLGVVSPIKFLSKFLIAIALAAIGLNTDFRSLKKIGPRPMLLGLGASVLIGAVGWIVIRLFYV